MSKKLVLLGALLYTASGYAMWGKGGGYSLQTPETILKNTVKNQMGQYYEEKKELLANLQSALDLYKKMGSDLDKRGWAQASLCFLGEGCKEFSRTYKGDVKAYLQMAASFYEGVLNLGPYNIRAPGFIEVSAAAVHDTLGTVYYQEKKFEEAAAHFSCASEHDISYGTMQLADMYQEGIGVPKNLEEALRLYKKVEEYGLDNTAGAKVRQLEKMLEER